MKKRNRFPILCSIFLLFAALCPASTLAIDTAPFLGDLNGGQPSTAADAARMLRGIASAKISEDAQPELDFTQNGQVDGVDARAVLFYACGGIPDWGSFGERVSSGLCDERLFDRFSYTGTRDDGMGNYKSENVCVQMLSGRMENNNYHVLMTRR